MMQVYTFPLRELPISPDAEKLELHQENAILFSWGVMGWSLGLLERLEIERNPRKERATEEDIHKLPSNTRLTAGLNMFGQLSKKSRRKGIAGG